MRRALVIAAGAVGLPVIMGGAWLATEFIFEGSAVIMACALGLFVLTVAGIGACAAMEWYDSRHR